MRVGSAILLTSLTMAVFQETPAQIDGSGTEIPAATRLRDYLLRSRYPETNRLLKSDDPSLFETPLLAGDASAAATITAFAGEKLHHGSLRIFFRVSVRQPGFYSFRTQLMAETGRPLVEALLHQSLGAGEHQLYFFVYGKALRDAGASGSFVLPGIVGEKLPEDGITGAAQQGALSALRLTYKTQPYRSAVFTDKEWTSPEKQATIRRLQREIRQENMQKR
ncbi:hypothetical protein Turpa_0939 [Turneriella parva DSM 21527]|uniref:Uncharacterized protein n=2 Tax=Turneriella TaxID=338321 RepID=I4B2T1_TURPD|nr:hypothetical protein Turpa_0939 [Turneriella parva DSM 21527]